MQKHRFFFVAVLFFASLPFGVFAQSNLQQSIATSPPNYYQIVEMMHLCTDAQFSTTQLDFTKRPVHDQEQESLSAALTVIIGLMAQMAEAIINKAPYYDLAAADSYTTILDNVIYAYISEIEHLTGDFTGNQTDHSTLANTAHSLGYIAVGSFLFPDNLHKLKALNIVGVWCIRRGIGSIGTQLTDCARMLEYDNATIDYAASALFCTPTVVTIFLFPQHTKLLLLTEMGCAHASTFSQTTRLNQLVEQGYSPRQANRFFIGESLLIALLMNRLGNGPVFLLVTSNALKVCADCVLSEIKEVILPEAGVLRTTFEFATETSLVIIAFIPNFKFSNSVAKIFMSKIRDHAIYYETRRLTQYTATLLTLILTTFLSWTQS